MSGSSRTSDWSWDGTPVQVGYDVRGKGETVLLPPALSTISTRDGMGPLAACLGEGFRTVALTGRASDRNGSLPGRMRRTRISAFPAPLPNRCFPARPRWSRPDTLLATLWR